MLDVLVKRIDHGAAFIHLALFIKITADRIAGVCARFFMRAFFTNCF
jgi:hypothetical protein